MFQRFRKKNHDGPVWNPDLNLPAGWSKFTDQSGGEFYRNNTTQAVQYERPTSDVHPVNQQDNTPQLANVTNHSNSSISQITQDFSSGWAPCIDPASGRTYYTEIATGRTAWEIPVNENEVNQTSMEMNNSNTRTTAQTMAHAAYGEVSHQRQQHQYQQQLQQQQQQQQHHQYQQVSSSRAMLDGNSTQGSSFSKLPSPFTSSVPSDVNNASNNISPIPIPQSEMNPYAQRNSENSKNYEDSMELKSDNAASWGMPTQTLDMQTPMGAQTADTSSPFQNEVNYEEIVDLNSGRTYYRNLATGETSWEKPTLPPEAGGETQNASSSPVQPNQTSPEVQKENNSVDESEYQEYIDQASGRPYYRNTITGEVSWEKKKNAVNLHSQEQVKTKRRNSQLPPGWSAIVDEMSGRTYYTNPHEGKISWQRPSNTIQEADSNVDDYQDNPSNQGNEEIAEDEEYYHDGTQWIQKSNGQAQDNTETYRTELSSDAQSHSYFMLCCDMRKAVILTNFVALISYILFIVIIFVGVDFLGTGLDNVVNALFREITSEDIKSWLRMASSRPYELIYAGFSILFCLLGLFGGYKFNVVMWNVNMYLASAPFLFFTANISGLLYFFFAMFPKEIIILSIGCVANVVYLYPHIVFFFEVKRGIMNSGMFYTKNDVSHWCCCTKGSKTLDPSNETSGGKQNPMTTAAHSEL